MWVIGYPPNMKNERRKSVWTSWNLDDARILFSQFFVCFINTAKRLIKHKISLNAASRCEHVKTKRTKLLLKDKSKKSLCICTSFYLYFFFCAIFLSLGCWALIMVNGFICAFISCCASFNVSFFSLRLMVYLPPSIRLWLMVNLFGCFIIIILHIVHVELNCGKYFEASSEDWRNFTDADDSDYNIYVWGVRERLNVNKILSTGWVCQQFFYATSKYIHEMAIVAVFLLLFFFSFSSQTFQSGKCVWSNLWCCYCCCCCYTYFFWSCHFESLPARPHTHTRGRFWMKNFYFVEESFCHHRRRTRSTAGFVCLYRHTENSLIL